MRYIIKVNNLNILLKQAANDIRGLSYADYPAT